MRKSAKIKKGIFDTLTHSADLKIGCYDISRHGCIYCKRFHSSDTTFNLTVSMEQCVMDFLSHLNAKSALQRRPIQLLSILANVRNENAKN